MSKWMDTTSMLGGLRSTSSDFQMSDPYYNLGEPHPGDDDWPHRPDYKLHPDAAALLKMLGIQWGTTHSTADLRVYLSSPRGWSAWTDPVPSYEDVARLVAMWDAKTSPAI